MSLKPPLPRQLQAPGKAPGRQQLMSLPPPACRVLPACRPSSPEPAWGSTSPTHMLAGKRGGFAEGGWALLSKWGDTGVVTCPETLPKWSVCLTAPGLLSKSHQTTNTGGKKNSAIPTQKVSGLMKIWAAKARFKPAMGPHGLGKWSYSFWRKLSSYLFTKTLIFLQKWKWMWSVRLFYQNVQWHTVILIKRWNPTKTKAFKWTQTHKKTSNWCKMWGWNRPRSLQRYHSKQNRVQGRSPLEPKDNLQNKAVGKQTFCVL